MTTTTLGRSLAFALLAGTMLSPALAHDTGHDDKRGAERFGPGVRHVVHSDADLSGLPPLYGDLGEMHMQITTGDPRAQAYFDQGLRLIWGFNHAEAVRSFRAAQAIDPGCAMCFWGEAFALGPNINDAMSDTAGVEAQTAVLRAVALADGGTEREADLIGALARRYDPAATRADLDAAWAEAMGAVVQAYPDDADILVLHADALMNLQPWDFWAADGVTPKGRAAEIVATLERALEIDPDHLAAMHLYIHAIEASADPARAETVADRLRGKAPAAGHLSHMPAHIYARIGRHHDSVAVNREAIAADEAFLAVSDAASPLYRYGYFPHNVHYLLVSAQMAGLAEDVIASADRLAEITSDGVSQDLAWVQAIKTAPYSGHAQFGEDDAILALPDPGDRFPLVKGFWHYARGLAYFRSGDLAEAELEADAIERLVAAADMSDLEAQYLPARDVLTIAANIVRARSLAAGGAHEEAVTLLRATADLEAGIGYMEPPYWYYPVEQTLGAVLLDAGRPDEAIVAFETALGRMPRNGWALWGLLKAREAVFGPNPDQADAAELAELQNKLRSAWLGDTALLRRDRL